MSTNCNFCCVKCYFKQQPKSQPYRYLYAKKHWYNKPNVEDFINYIKCLFDFTSSANSIYQTRYPCYRAFINGGANWKSTYGLEMCSNFVNECIKNFTGRDLNFYIFTHNGNSGGLLNVYAVKHVFVNKIYSIVHIGVVPNGSILYVRRRNINTYAHVMFYLGGFNKLIAGANHGDPMLKNGIYSFDQLFTIYNGNYFYKSDFARTDELYFSYINLKDVIYL